MLVPAVLFRREHFGGLAYRVATEQYFRLSESAFALLELASHATEDAAAAHEWGQAITDASLAAAIRGLAEAGLLREAEQDFALNGRALRGSGVWTNGPWLSGPVTVEIYPQFHCNERCQFCYVGTQVERPPHPPMRRECIAPLVQNLAEAGVFNVTVLGGEPFLYRHVAELLDALGERRFDVAISTNGTVLHTDALSVIQRHSLKLNLAVHGDTDAVHDGLVRRTGAFRLAVATARAAVTLGLSPNLTIVITPANIDRTEKIVEFVARDLGIKSITLNYAQASAYCVGNNMTIGFDDFVSAFRTARRRGAELGIHVTVSSHYSFLIPEAERLYDPDNPLSAFMYGDKAGRWSLEMEPNGDLYPGYEFFGKPEWTAGNAFRDNLGEVWALSPALARIRSRPLPAFCAECEHRRVCGGGLLSRPFLRGELDTPPRDCPLVQALVKSEPGAPSDRPLRVLPWPHTMTKAAAVQV